MNDANLPPIKITRLLQKTADVGMTAFMTKIFDEHQLQLLHSVVVLGPEHTKSNFSLVIGQVRSVQCLKGAADGVDVLTHNNEVNQTFSDVIDLSAPVLYFGVGLGHEVGVVHYYQFGCDVYDRIIFDLPNEIELTFDPNTSPLSDGLDATFTRTIDEHLLFNDRDTFIQWFRQQG